MERKSNYILKGVLIMSIETMLKDEIKDEMEELKKLTPGSEEHKIATDSITKLYDRVIEMEKLEAEAEERKRNREVDNELKQQQLEDTKKDNRIKNAISIAGIVIPVATTIWGAIKTFEFEKEGTITTIFGRGFINKLLKK